MKDNRKGVKFRSDQYRTLKEWFDRAFPLIEERNIHNGEVLKDKDGNVKYECRPNFNDALTFIFEDNVDGFSKCFKHQDKGVKFVKYTCPLCYPNSEARGE